MRKVMKMMTNAKRDPRALMRNLPRR
jgi:hypothetical protein